MIGGQDQDGIGNDFGSLLLFQIADVIPGNDTLTDMRTGELR